MENKKNHHIDVTRNGVTLRIIISATSPAIAIDEIKTFLKEPEPAPFKYIGQEIQPLEKP